MIWAICEAFSKDWKWHEWTKASNSLLLQLLKKLPGTGTQILPCYRNQIFLASTISMERFDDELKVFTSQGKHYASCHWSIFSNATAHRHISPQHFMIPASCVSSSVKSLCCLLLIIINRKSWPGGYKVRSAGQKAQSFNLFLRGRRRRPERTSSFNRVRC